MSDKEWDQISEVHLKGAFSCTKAAWPLFRKQKFGRVINTSSAAGLYGICKSSCLSLLSHRLSGNFGQANYSAAKMGLVAFTKTLAREGAKYNIKSTVIAPVRPLLYPPQPGTNGELDGCLGYDRNCDASRDVGQLERMHPFLMLRVEFFVLTPVI